MIFLFAFKIFIAALTVTTPVSANTPIRWNDFWDGILLPTLRTRENASQGANFYTSDGGKRAAMAAVPMYHFGAPRGETPCYPEDAEYNGV